MRNKLTFILFGLLISVGWTSVMAQTQPSVSPAQRLSLTLVDNVSVYDVDAQTNTYTNTLQLSQPTGDYKLTAGMLNEGNNYITIHRLDNTGGDVEFLRVNLNAAVQNPEYKLVDLLDFYGDGSSAPSTAYYMTATQLAALSTNWGTDGSGLRMQTNGFAYASTQTGLSFIVPAGYSNEVFEFDIMVGYDASTHFIYNVNGGDWEYGSSASQYNYSAFTVPGLSSGDVVYFYGYNSSSGQLTYTPDIAWIETYVLPKSFVSSIEVTPSISTYDFDNNTWGNATAGTATTYDANGTINLDGLGNLDDIFSVSTATNDYPDSYSYKADLDANIVLPAPGESATSFNASIDFTQNSISITGEGTWSMNEAGRSYVNNQNNIAAIINYWGDILFNIPATFTGNQLTVTVTSCPGTEGAGELYVNEISHTFTASSSYTWTVNVAANGFIEFKAPSSSQSVGISSIVISSGNSSSLNAPQHNFVRHESLKPEHTVHKAVLPEQLKAKSKVSIEAKEGINEVRNINDNKRFQL